MELKIYKSVADINEAEWDAIVGKNKIFCTHKFASAVEKSVFNKDGCYYPVIYDDGKIIAHACVYFFRTELDLFARGLLKHLFTRIYFEGEAGNAGDPLLTSIENAAARGSLLARHAAGTGPALYHFDIVLQGENETAFLDI